MIFVYYLGAKVKIITTSDSCSATELVINGLRPHIDVRVVGEKTCGKPVGMSGFDFCGNYLLPIQFGLTNSNGEGDYFDGLQPVCSVLDDIKHDFGDRDEAMLKETIYLLKNGNCSPASVSKQTRKIEAPSEKQLPEILTGWHREVGAI